MTQPKIKVGQVCERAEWVALFEAVSQSGNDSTQGGTE